MYTYIYTLQLQNTHRQKLLDKGTSDSEGKDDAIKSVYITQHSPHTHNIFMLLIPILPKRPRAPICNLNNASAADDNADRHTKRFAFDRAKKQRPRERERERVGESG